MKVLRQIIGVIVVIAGGLMVLFVGIRSGIAVAAIGAVIVYPKLLDRLTERRPAKKQ